MSIKGYYLLPHPPIVVPEVGKGEEQKIIDTIKGFDAVGKEIAQKKPDTIIIITPHGTMFQDAVSISYEDDLCGDLGRFGASSVSMKTRVNRELASKINQFSNQYQVPSVLITNSFLKKYNASIGIDHGCMVPLYFINKFYKEYKIVIINYAFLGDMDLYKFGMAVRNAVEESGEEVVLIASGDLSHALKEEGPYRYNKYGEVFDKKFLEYLKNGDLEGLFNIPKEIVSGAGECGRRSVVIMTGALDEKKIKGELLSYQGTFGVGYGVMRFDAISDEESFLSTLEKMRVENQEKKKNQSDPYVRLARESLEHYLKEGEKLKTLPKYVTDEMKNTKRGVFVSLKKYGDLRGCIGTVFPTTDCIAMEIIRNGIEAGTRDPRFEEVMEYELLDIDFSVDVLTEPIESTKEELDPKKYGVIVRSKGKTGLLLPDLENVDTVEEQLSIALKKGGIREEEGYGIQRFEVIRHKEM